MESRGSLTETYNAGISLSTLHLLIDCVVSNIAKQTHKNEIEEDQYYVYKIGNWPKGKKTRYLKEPI